MAGAWANHLRPETERLFEENVPSAPVTSSSTVPPVASGFGSVGGYVANEDSTLDEPVWQTLLRDLKTIAVNLRTVLVPVNWDFNNQGSGALRNWDLWGPLIFMLMLAITLSWGEEKPSDVFALVFIEVAIGSIILTLNVILIGGNIVFFQSLCLLGYCLFPIDVAAIVCAIVNSVWIRTLVLVVSLAWSSFATVPFVSKTVPQARRALAVYPVMLMYLSIGWLALVKR